MKHLYIISFLLSFPLLPGYSQNTAVTIIDTNHIAAHILSTGHLFNNGSSSHGFEVPKGSGKHCIYSSHLWAGGTNTSSGLLHIAAEQYPLAGGDDFWTGPVANTYSTTYDSTYERFWVISRADIQNHLNGISTSNDILTWPAHGDVSNGEAANLAPFVDINNNGIYEPTSGEYPMFKGDKAVYFIYNDDRASHTNTWGNPLSIEVHTMIYQYDRSNFLDNVVFVSYSIFNRSGNDYNNFYLGHFDDFDIGNYSNDYVGCSIAHDTYFGYNGSQIDNNGGGVLGYDTLPPAVGVTFLNRSLRTFKYYSSTSPISGATDPNIHEEYYNYLKGIWLDGYAMVVGGSGHPTDPLATSTPSLHMFPGDIMDMSQWSEVSAANAPGDRRGLGTTNQMLFSSGDNICLDLAYTFHQSNAGAYQSVPEMLDIVDSVKTFYNNENFQCHEAPVIAIDPTWSGITSNALNHFTLYPNPAQNEVWIEAPFNVSRLSVNDMLGRTVLQHNLSDRSNTKLDVSLLIPGIYVVNLFEKGVLLGSQKLIIE